MPLTTGVDLTTGGAGADTFNFVAVDATGAAATTLGANDVIDGGAGVDTVNITRATSYNGTLQGTFSNVEIININNTDATAAAAVDASLFGAAATSIQQTAKAANVTKLASTTTAAIKGATLGANLNAGVAGAAGAVNASTTGSSLSVAAGSTATSAAITLDAVKGDTAAASAITAVASTVGAAGTAGANATVANQAVLAVNGAALNAVTVAGTLAKNTGVTTAATLKLDVTTGKNVQAATVNTAVATTLSVTKSSDSTKDVTSVDASASAGAVTYSAASTVATVKTGAGADDVTVATATAKDNADTATDETVNAVVETNAGKDKLTINTSGAGNTTASTGADADTITITGASTGTVSVDAGAGDDVIKANATLTTKTSISGGDGVDTVEVAGAAAYAAGDYALYDAAFSNVETLKFVTNAAGNTTAVDASQLVDFNKFVFAAGTNSAITKVGTQALALSGTATGLTATAAGYVAASGSVATVYAGNLAVATGVNSSTATLNAESATVTVNTDGTAGTAAADIAATVKGDLKTLNLALNSVRNSDADGVATGAESLASATVALDASTANDLTLNALTSVKVTGAGSVTINAAADGETTNDAAPAGKLTSIDLSGMTAFAELNVNGDQVTTNTVSSTSYGYKNLSTSSVTLNNAVAESLVLGGADDTVTTSSTYDKMDTITGFELVASTTTVTNANADKSDAIDVAGTIAFSKMTVTATTLAGAFLDAAAVANDASAKGTIFVFDGNTYLYVDGNGVATGSGGSANGVLDASDVAIKLVGVYNEALLAQVAG